MRAAVRFAFSEGTLNTDAKAQLKRLAPVIAAATRVRITGFTDDKGAQEPNDKLASERALAVVLYLREGLQINGAELVGTGRALCCYRTQNTDEAGRAVNRRAELDIELPQGEATDRLVQNAASDLFTPDGRAFRASGITARFPSSRAARLASDAPLAPKVTP